MSIWKLILAAFPDQFSGIFTEGITGVTMPGTGAPAGDLLQEVLS